MQSVTHVNDDLRSLTSSRRRETNTHCGALVACACQQPLELKRHVLPVQDRDLRNPRRSQLTAQRAHQTINTPGLISAVWLVRQCVGNHSYRGHDDGHSARCDLVELLREAITREVRVAIAHDRHVQGIEKDRDPVPLQHA